MGHVQIDAQVLRLPNWLSDHVDCQLLRRIEFIARRHAVRQEITVHWLLRGQPHPRAARTVPDSLKGLPLLLVLKMLAHVLDHDAVVIHVHLRTSEALRHSVRLLLRSHHHLSLTEVGSGRRRLESSLVAEARVLVHALKLHVDPPLVLLPQRPFGLLPLVIRIIRLLVLCRHGRRLDVALAGLHDLEHLSGRKIIRHLGQV